MLLHKVSWKIESWNKRDYTLQRHYGGFNLPNSSKLLAELRHPTNYLQPNEFNLGRISETEEEEEEEEEGRQIKDETEPLQDELALQS